MSGTTEKIFESKISLYDVYVDNQVVRTHNPVLKELLKCSSADREKLQKLNNLRFVSILLARTFSKSLLSLLITHCLVNKQ